MKTLRTLKLRALKSHRYGTRHLEAGDEYEAPIRQAVAMVVTRKAKVADKTTKQHKEIVEVTTSQGRLERLRAQADVLGINVDGRWGVARLEYEITAARKTE